MSSLRNCFITINNYTEEEIENIKTKFKSTYYVIGKEVGMKSQLPHIHCYIEFTGSVRFDTIKKKLPRARIETRKGTVEQAIGYCKKENNFVEEGTPSRQGNRSDIHTLAQKIVDGATLRDIAIEAPGEYVKYHKGFLALKLILMEDRTTKPYVEWRFGLAGVGKTRKIREMYGSENVYIKKPENKWWDNYMQQKCVIIDDFYGSWAEGKNDFHRLLDYGAYDAEVKTSTVKINSPYIYITCEHPPWFFWKNNDLDQVLRRLDKIMHVTKDGEVEIPNPFFIEKNVADVAEVAGNTYGNSCATKIIPKRI